MVWILFTILRTLLLQTSHKNLLSGRKVGQRMWVMQEGRTSVFLVSPHSMDSVFALFLTAPGKPRWWQRCQRSLRCLWMDHITMQRPETPTHWQRLGAEPAFGSSRSYPQYSHGCPHTGFSLAAMDEEQQGLPELKWF